MQKVQVPTYLQNTCDDMIESIKEYISGHFLVNVDVKNEIEEVNYLQLIPKRFIIGRCVRVWSALNTKPHETLTFVYDF